MSKYKVVFVVAWAAGSIAGIAACGGQSSSSGNLDAMGTADAPGTPATDGSPQDTEPPGTMHHGYVISHMLVPASDPQVSAYGLDLGSATSSAPDGTVDNALGKFFNALNTISPDIIQGTINTAVDQGSILMLLDLGTTSFVDASAVTLGVKLGSDPVPAACSDAADTICRHHLTGTASFSIAPSSPADTVTSGAIAAGTFNGGPGALVLQIAIGSTSPIKLDLLHARIRASSISTGGITTANIGGLVTLDEMFGKVCPALQAQFASILDHDCTPGGAGTPPKCGCATGSTGAAILAKFDGDMSGSARDCTVTTTEILSAPELKPDSCPLDSCPAATVLSIGVKVDAVGAMFPM